MHCASCVAKIEKALKMPGVSKAGVNFASEKAYVEYDENKLDRSDIVRAIRKAGYEAIEDAEKDGVQKIELKVVGMSSPHCAGIVSKALNSAKGIKKADVDFASEKAVIEYESPADVQKIKKTVRDAGYEPVEIESPDKEKIAREKEIRLLKMKFIVAAVLSVPIFLGSFPEWFPWVPEILQNLFVLLMLAAPVQFWAGWQFYKGAWYAAKQKTTDMNTLIAVGTSAAYFYSAAAVFLGGAVYFDTAAIIITLIILGRYLESVMKGRTSEAIKKLIKLQAKTARVIRNGKEIEIPIEDVRVGDIVVVKPGEKIPVDGMVVDGYSAWVRCPSATGT